MSCKLISIYKTFRKLVASGAVIDQAIPVSDWAEQNIDYGKAKNYDTPYRGKFNKNLMPFWNQPLDDLQDYKCREVAVLKCSRAGYSENLVLTDLRYVLALFPEPTLYVTARKELAQGFLDRRVKRGMALTRDTWKKFRHARSVDQDIQMPDMDFRATWSTSDTAVKQDGWARIYCDEVSLWKEFTVDMIRRRAAAYPFHHIVFGGSVDPSRKGNPEEDPMLKLYLESNMNVWKMPDPKTGNLFSWSMDGIKWDKECKVDDEWDLGKVESSAYYETPDGTRIEEEDRMPLSRSGMWIETGAGHRRGYKIVAPMVPFSDCSFGNLAKQFLSAKYRMSDTTERKDRTKNTIRTYFAEYWAEVKREEQIEASDDSLVDREAVYEIGTVYVSKGMTSGVFLTADVQKYHLWWVARVWAMNDKTGDVESAMLDYGTSPSFAEFDELAASFSPSCVGIDIGYEQRASEVADYCAEYTENPTDASVLALRGSDKLTKSVIDAIVRDAREGRSSSRGASKYLELMWNTDVFRTWLIEMINGEHKYHWVIPNEWKNVKRRNEYVKQVASTKKVDGDWIPPRHRQDHLFDCEVMQLVLARYDGLIR